MVQKNQAITIAYGDGIGPELMDSVVRILQASGAKLHFNIIEVGEEIYNKGFISGLMPSAWEELKNTKILLKAPITTPQGGGYKSLNVTIRKKLGLYANIRPVTSLYPYINSKHPNMDVVIILVVMMRHRTTAVRHHLLFISKGILSRHHYTTRLVTKKVMKRRFCMGKSPRLRLNLKAKMRKTPCTK